MSEKPRILFVDDESRVLKSMRGLFRREFELFLTTEGAEAVKLAQENSIDVIVADQRMPGMTGIEVLGKVREQSPRTVRILLTGYADPSAVEGSINIGEVFRFLSKPCPPKLLRETLQLAIAASRETLASAVVNPAVETTVSPPPARRPEVVATPTEHRPPTSRPEDTEAPTPSAEHRPPMLRPEKIDAPAPSAEPRPPMRRPEKIDAPAPFAEHRPPMRRPEKIDAPALSAEPAVAIRPPAPAPFLKPDTNDTDATSSHWETVTEVILSGDTCQEIQTGETGSYAVGNLKDIGVVVFTVDSEFAEATYRALSGDRNTMLATTLAKVAEAIEHDNAGILVTDFTTNSAVLQKIISVLKQHLPELVTIVVSGSRDTTDMISLINHGQVFRYILKPLDSQSLRNNINAAAVRHIQLRDNPQLNMRHRVMNLDAEPDPSATLNQFVSRIRSVRARSADPTDSTA